MKYQREGLILPEPSNPAADEALNASFIELTGGVEETYAELALSSDEAQRVKESWHAGEDASLVTSKDADSLLMRQAALRQWKRELLERDDVEPLVKQLYRWKVNESIANVNMLIASQSGDMVGFRRWNEFIYGKPDADVYRGALDWVAGDAQAIVVGEHPQQVKEAAQAVLAQLEGKRGYKELLAPEPEVFERVREDHMAEYGYYGLLLAGVEVPQGKITTEIADPIIQQLLKNIKSTKGVKDASGASWSVDSESVRRPKVLNMPSKRFVGLGLGHEVGSHELERVNGARGPIKLASQGLDRYESGNEGTAVVREQVPYESFDEFGKLVRWRDILRRHIAVSYAYGIGEDAPRSSSEVHDFMNTIDYMYSLKLKPDDEAAAREASVKKTDDLLIRVLKGTDGRGGAYLKDKVYLEGNIAVWLQAARRGPTAISEGDLGKFDINNPRHLHALQSLDLLPVGE
jgi:hypothetical protein